MKVRLTLLLIYPALLLGLLLTAARYLFAVVGSPNKAWWLAIAIDETCNVVANGKRHETISTRAAVAKRNGTKWGCVLCKLLEGLDPGHCDRALELRGPDNDQLH